jgi:hypothetical protein
LPELIEINGKIFGCNYKPGFFKKRKDEGKIRER